MSDDNRMEDFDSFHNKLLGLGRNSLRKSYYPELQKRIEELEKIQKELNKYKDHLEELVVERTNELKKINEQLQREITERKQAEEELRQSEAMLSSVFKAAPIGICVVNNRILLSANKAWLESSGYSEDEIIGHTTKRLYESKKEYERIGRKVYTNLLKNGFASVQTTHRRKDGSILDVILTAVPLQTQDISSKMFVVTVQDITEHKRAEEALRRSEEKFRLMVENSHDIIYSLTADGVFAFVSPTWTELLGHPVTQVTGKPFQIFIHPEDISRCMEFLKSVIETGQKKEGVEYRVKHANGTWYWHTSSAVPFKNKSGVTGFYGITRDITARKQADAEKQRLEEQLNRAQKMEALGTLAGGVAHDLNNVLGVLIGYSELLTGELPAGSFLQKCADNILKSGMKGSAIIQDLLTLARRGVNVSEVVNLNKIIIEYLGSPEFEKLKSYHPNVKIGTELEGGLLNVKGSPIHLGKTIMNLVSNAAEAISGQGEVTVRTENRYLDHPVRGYDTIQEGNYAVLTVSDTGSGISVRDLSKIFEPFYTKKVMGRSGTGLGLAVVWGTVKDHNGYIDVQSEEEKGSTFTLYFPITRENIPKSPIAIPAEAYMGKGESILVVDDVQEQRELAISILRTLRYQVETVAGGEEAIEYLKNKKVDLIILDMIMDPGIDGMETYRRILEISPRQKAIIVSGFSETDRVRNAQEMGAGAFVRKPYILGEIGLAVKKELERK